MGWWSASILGGDGPLDVLGDLADICGVGDYEKNGSDGPSELYGYDFSKELLQKKEKEILKYFSEFPDNQDIQFQVYGVILMGTGSPISSKTKKKITQAIDSDDSWDKEDKREVYLNEYRRKLASYDNKTPTFLTTEGLFEKLGQTAGLINKNL